MRLIIPTILALSLLPGGFLQKSKTSVDTGKLLGALKSALGDHLTITKHELTKTSVTMGSDTYWLVFVQPQHSGDFDFKYRYKYNEPRYSHVEKRFPLRVGKQGCRRGPQGNGYYGKFCLGDTIILPTLINRFTEHTFSLEVSTLSDDDDPPAESRAGLSDVVNPASAHLELLTSRSYRSLHRAGGYTLEGWATFEARQPGRFNLAPASGDIAISDLRSSAGGTPIIVVPRNAPLTLLAAREHTTGFAMGYDGREYESSSGGNTNYLTTVWIVQTGDTIELSYGSERYSAKEEYAQRKDGSFKENDTSAPPKIF